MNNSDIEFIRASINDLDEKLMTEVLRILAIITHNDDFKAKFLEYKDYDMEKIQNILSERVPELLQNSNSQQQEPSQTPPPAYRQYNGGKSNRRQQNRKSNRRQQNRKSNRRQQNRKSNRRQQNRK